MIPSRARPQTTSWPPAAVAFALDVKTLLPPPIQEGLPKFTEGMKANNLAVIEALCR